MCAAATCTSLPNTISIRRPNSGYVRINPVNHILSYLIYLIVFYFNLRCRYILGSTQPRSTVHMYYSFDDIYMMSARLSAFSSFLPLLP